MLALLLWAFATYGLVTGIYKFFRYLYVRVSDEHRLTLVIVVKNGEVYVEGLLRFIGYKAFLARKELRIVIIDTGSQDATCEIIRRLQKYDARIELVQTIEEFDSEILKNLWQTDGMYNPFVLLDLRGWKNPRKIASGIARIIG